MTVKGAQDDSEKRMTRKGAQDDGKKKDDGKERLRMTNEKRSEEGGKRLGINSFR